MRSARWRVKMSRESCHRTRRWALPAEPPVPPYVLPPALLPLLAETAAFRVPSASTPVEAMRGLEEKRLQQGAAAQCAYESA